LGANKANRESFYTFCVSLAASSDSIFWGKMRKNSKFHMWSLLWGVIPGIIIGLTVNLLIPVLENPIRQSQTNPKIIFEKQSAQFPEVCTKTINFGTSMNANFNIKYKNIGDAVGALKIKLESPGLQSKVDGTTSAYSNITEIDWLMEPGTVQDIRFKLKRADIGTIKNITFMAREICSFDTIMHENKSCGQLTAYCHYKPMPDTGNLVLVNSTFPAYIKPADDKAVLEFTSFFEKINARLSQSRRWALYQ
jgi:hypothetical protein